MRFVLNGGRLAAAHGLLPLFRLTILVLVPLLGLTQLIFYGTCLNLRELWLETKARILLFVEHLGDGQGQIHVALLSIIVTLLGSCTMVCALLGHHH